MEDGDDRTPSVLGPLLLAVALFVLALKLFAWSFRTLLNAWAAFAKTAEKDPPEKIVGDPPA